MTSTIHLVGHEHDDRQRVISAVRATRIDQLAPDHREAVLAAERYLDSESAYGKVTEQKLRRWRTGAPGLDWMSFGWLKNQNR